MPGDGVGPSGRGSVVLLRSVLLGLPGLEVAGKQLWLEIEIGVFPGTEDQPGKSDRNKNSSGNNQPMRQFQQWHGDTSLPLMNTRPRVSAYAGRPPAAIAHDG